MNEDQESQEGQEDQQTQVQNPPVQSQPGPAPTVQPGATGSQPTVDPEEIRQQALYHLSEAKRLHDQRLNEQAPTLEHHKTGIGIYLASLLATALDKSPNKDAGVNLLNAYKGATAQRDDENNQRKNQMWLQRQGVLGQNAQQESATGQGLLKTAQEGDALKQKGKTDADRLSLQKELGDVKDRENRRTNFNNTMRSGRAILDNPKSEPQARKEAAAAMMAAISQNSDIIDPGVYKDDIAQWDKVVKTPTTADTLSAGKVTKAKTDQLKDQEQLKKITEDNREARTKFAQEKEKKAWDIKAAIERVNTMQEENKERKLKFPLDVEKLKKGNEELDLRMQSLRKSIARGDKGDVRKDAEDLRKSFQDKQKYLRGVISDNARQVAEDDKIISSFTAEKVDKDNARTDKALVVGQLQAANHILAGWGAKYGIDLGSKPNGGQSEDKRGKAMSDAELHAPATDDELPSVTGGVPRITPPHIKAKRPHAAKVRKTKSGNTATLIGE